VWQSVDLGVGVSILSSSGGVQFGLITDKKLCAEPQRIIDRFAPEFEKIVLALCLLPWERAVDPDEAESWLFPGVPGPAAAAPKARKRKPRKAKSAAAPAKAAPMESAPAGGVPAAAEPGAGAEAGPAESAPVKPRRARTRRPAPAAAPVAE